MLTWWFITWNQLPKYIYENFYDTKIFSLFYKMKLDTGYYNEYIVSQYYIIEPAINESGKKVDNRKIIIDGFLVI